MDISVTNLIQTAFEHHKAGRLPEAEALYRQILQHQPDYPEVLGLLGFLMQTTGRAETGIQLVQRAAALHPSYYHFHNVGILLKNNEKYAEALEYYNAALALKPDFVPSLENSAVVLEQLMRFDEAAERYSKAVAIHPYDIRLMMGAAAFFMRLGDFDRAVAYYRTGLTREPDNIGLLNNLALALYYLGRPHEAIPLQRRVLVGEPDNAGYHYNFAGMLFYIGEFEEGFREYQWRWKTPSLQASDRHFPQPLWKGEDIRGKTLLIHGEMGFGDSLQFCRYATQAAERGIRVILDVPLPLVRLMTTLKGVDQVIPTGAPLPPFDYHCPVMDLVAAFRTTVATIPSHTPYLFADPQALALWQQRLPPTPGIKKIGLVWAGNPRKHIFHNNPTDRRRSIDPQLFAPLMALPGFAFYSLQKEHAKAPDNFPIIDLMPFCQDFADTAALVMQLDLVICVDTSVAHLVGALGKPVWILSRMDGCWRWLLNRSDSPWYPTMRIFRQKESRNWPEVIQRVTAALRDFGHTS